LPSGGKTANPISMAGKRGHNSIGRLWISEKFFAKKISVGFGGKGSQEIKKRVFWVSFLLILPPLYSGFDLGWTESWFLRDCAITSIDRNF